MNLESENVKSESDLFAYALLLPSFTKKSKNPYQALKEMNSKMKKKVKKL
jgi:hypothetical protein